MRLLICWPAFTGYMAACWRALHGRQGVELTVIAGDRYAGAAFDAGLVGDLNCHLLPAEALQNRDAAADLAKAARPDVIFIAGWSTPSFTALLDHPSFRDTPFMSGMDNQHFSTWRQWLGRQRLRRFLARMQRFFVPGDRARQYARYLGVPADRIVPAYLGVDRDRFLPLLQQRQALPGGWPRRFLFAGSYVMATKAVDVLAKGYRRYREQVAGAGEEAWPLVCCGTGPDAGRLRDQAGVEDRGFMQPDAMLGQMRDAGVFVMPSRREAFGLAIVEAAAGGLPIIATSVCGASVECVRHRGSGLIIPSDDARALAAAMHWMHEQHERLPEMGRVGQALSAGYDAQTWADQWLHAARAVLSEVGR